MSQNSSETADKNLSGIYKVSTNKLSNEEVIQILNSFDREKHIFTDQPLSELEITNGTVVIYDTKDP